MLALLAVKVPEWEACKRFSHVALAAKFAGKTNTIFDKQAHREFREIGNLIRSWIWRALTTFWGKTLVRVRPNRSKFFYVLNCVNTIILNVYFLRITLVNITAFVNNSDRPHRRGLRKICDRLNNTKINGKNNTRDFLCFFLTFFFLWRSGWLVLYLNVGAITRFGKDKSDRIIAKCFLRVYLCIKYS